MKPATSTTATRKISSSFVFFVFFCVTFVFGRIGAKGEIAGLGGIQRGSNRVEYADGAFNIRSGGKGGRELQINTHRVKTRSEWQFWEQVQCREKLFLGKGERRRQSRSWRTIGDDICENGEFDQRCGGDERGPESGKRGFASRVCRARSKGGYFFPAAESAAAESAEPAAEPTEPTAAEPAAEPTEPTAAAGDSNTC